ncbi:MULTISPECIES: hypothetical protein [unclassified Methylobacterium]|uniref:hypothetical protein n=1 Tax=unclassified Methylobacterium TaxID=2615210 RepID=UPI001FB9E391|nr:MULTISPECIES: hypothetical protein [unclassified Methylobacterium]MCJ2092052.1 hypothetical protein [Methylobacterium sp. J-072]MCJ2142397.1 hypothetical protein [Methylobacterium sp. E-066]
MTDTISSELTTGTLNSTDATALTSALSSIDTSLSSGTTSSTSGSSATNTKLDPSAMKDRIDSLISDQVSSGSLTSDQATELKNLFASHGKSTQTADATSSDADYVSGAGGPPPGHPPGPPPGTDASGSSASSTSSSGSSASDLLSTFIQQLQASQSSSASYGASGSTGTGTNASALLFDFQS